MRTTTLLPEDKRDRVLPTTWWYDTNAQTPRHLVSICMMYLSLWMVLAVLGVDRFTTLTTATVLSIAISSLAALIGATLGWRAWQGTQRTSVPQTAPNDKGSDQRILPFLFFILFPATTLCFTTTRLVGIAAQHLPGQSYRYTATVTDMHVGGVRAGCHLRVRLESTQSKSVQNTCLVARTQPIGPKDLRQGDPVVVEEKQNLFGRAVETIDRTP
jgi:hypothetical protein